MNLTFLLIAGLISNLGVSFAAGADDAAAAAQRRANTVILDPVSAKNLGLETAEAEEQSFENTLTTLGRVEVFPGKRAVVTSRVPGRVLEVPAYPDRAVKKGDPLVIIESRQPGSPSTEITLTAPIDGLVTDLIAVPGESVHPDKALLSLVDLSIVHALAQVPEHLADQILPGQKVRFRSPGWPGEVWTTKVEHLGATADPTTGTLEAACHINNEGTWLRPGMRGEFEFVTSSRPNVLSVPRSAVQQDGLSRFVFVADYELTNAYVKTPIVTGAENEQFVEVVQGLFPGDAVVTKGAYPLAFAGKGTVSLKEAMDAAHGHAHNEDGSEMTAEADHAHEAATAHGPAATSPWTWFFAGTTGVLAVLLVAQSLRRRGSGKDSGHA
ncbi:MAG: efflux RND transporter periplasmic adaptor subunit [Verrucomicrobia bacterium]|nr:efflux RND transporter periplasmic adaptor subunit [Verrucomicrobiota bacterium]